MAKKRRRAGAPISSVQQLDKPQLFTPEILAQARTYAFILCATILAYLPAIQGSFLWDDDAHITRPELQSLHGLWRIWFDLSATQQYYPLLHSAFWFEHLLWGNAVLGYHLTNIFLHAGAACLLVAIVRRLGLPAPWLAGFVFALHPVCVEAVAWISEQKSTLSAVFCLASALVYLHFNETRERSRYFLSLGLFVAALLSKTVTATLPAALLVVFWWQRGRPASSLTAKPAPRGDTPQPATLLTAGKAPAAGDSPLTGKPAPRGDTLQPATLLTAGKAPAASGWKRDVLPLLPWFVLSAGAALLTSWVEKVYIGAKGASFSLTLLERCLLACRAIWFYAGKIVWPADLIFVYPHWNINSAIWWQYLFPAGILAVLITLARLARRNRGPLAGFLIFAGTLFPALGFVNVFPFIYSYVADHFQYLATVAVIVPLASGLVLASRRYTRQEPWLPPILAGLLLVTLGALTWRQSAMYSDLETLYRVTLERNPGAWLAENNLGFLLLNDRARLPEAISHFRTALRLKPDYAEAHVNLGTAFSFEKQWPEAIAQFQEAVRIDPTYAHAHSDLASALAQIPTRLSEAIPEFEVALRYDPDSAGTHYNMARALMQLPGRRQDAIAHLREALRINPDWDRPRQLINQLQGGQ